MLKQRIGGGRKRSTQFIDALEDRQQVWLRVIGLHSSHGLFQLDKRAKDLLFHLRHIWEIPQDRADINLDAAALCSIDYHYEERKRGNQVQLYRFDLAVA